MLRIGKISTRFTIITLCFVVGLALLNPMQSAKSQAPSEKIESNDPAVTQTGEWSAQSAPSASGGSYLYSSGSEDDTLSLEFSGASLEVIYLAGPSLGTLAIEVDGTVLRTVITTADQTAYQQSAYLNYLSDEPHTVRAYAQAGGVIAVDAFVISSLPVYGVASGVDDTLASANAPRTPCDFTTPTQRPAESSAGVQATLETNYPVVSGNGLVVMFYSNDSTLVAGDTNGTQDVFVRDRATCTTTRVSVGTGGTQGDGNAEFYFDLSYDGRYVAFPSRATNLVVGDTNGQADIFVHDRQTNTTTRVNVATGGAQATSGDSFNTHISGDGRYVIFNSSATNLVTGDTNGQSDTFVHDRQTNTTTRVSVATGGAQSNNGIDFGNDISSDGRYIVFESQGTTLVAGDLNNLRDIFLHDRITGITRRVSVSTANGDSNGSSSSPSVSSDGRYVTFTSEASNLVAGDTNAVTDVFVYDTALNITTRLVAIGGAQPNANSYLPNITPDGRYIAFYSTATNFAAPDSPGTPDVFRHDRLTGETVRWNLHAATGQPGTVWSWYPSISDNGKVLAFESDDALVTGDTNGVRDVFIRLISPTGPDTLAMFNNAFFAASFVSTLDDVPPSAAYNSYTLSTAPASQYWLMGDWDGDGDDTPGVYANGAFWYTNGDGATSTWTGVWLGLIGRPAVAGRFQSGTTDCIGAVDSANFPPYGTAFALYFTCNLTGGAPALTFQWLSVLLPDNQGFTGTHQFGAGDFNNDGVETIAVRRGVYITWTNTPPLQINGEFPNAQYFGSPGTGEGTFVVGNWSIADNLESFGVLYPNGYFYYRNDLAFNSGIHYLQRLGLPVGLPTHVDSWR